jgi:4-hydroxybenzoate polyprenyltransferase
MIKTLLKSIRISWASKTVNMYLLALTYAYFSGVAINNPYQVLEGLILVCALWGALYSLNDLTDIESDRKDPDKQKRAFIQDRIEKKWVVLFVGVLVSLVFIISWATLPLSFTLIMALMLLNQIIYTVPPIRLKDTFLAPFTSTATNSVLRIASCCVLLGNLLLVPPSVYLFMYTASLGTYVMYKGRQKPASIIGAAAAVILAYTLYSGDMNLIQLVVAVVPASLAGIPLYLSLFTRKDKMVFLADILYHQVAMVFFLVAIVYILFY